MTVKFDRPVGAPADLKELEYISALHQTCPKLRQDASIDGKRKMNERMENDSWARPLTLRAVSSCPIIQQPPTL